MSINTSANPVPLPTDPPHPGTGPRDAWARIHRPRQDGAASRAIVPGPAPATTHELASARNRLTRVAAAAPLTVPTDAVPPARLDAGGTRLRLRALHVMGHNCVRIARALDVGETAIQEL